MSGKGGNGGESFSKVVQSSFWIYATSFLNSFCGFVFWLLISFFAGPTVVGIVSAIFSLSTLISGILNLGVPVGLIRWLGDSIGKGSIEDAKRFFWSSMFLLLFLFIPVSLIIGFLGYLGFSLGRYTSLTLIFTSILLVLSLNAVLISLYIGFMETFPYFLSSIIGHVLRISVGVSLVLLGLGWVGAATGSLMFNLAMTAVGILYVSKFVGLRPKFSLQHLREVLKAGFPSWLPQVVVVVGQQLAVISVFLMVGELETGTFYVAFTIGIFVVGLALAIQQMMLPYLSGLRDGRKRAAWNSLRVGLALTMPLVVGAAMFPQEILGLLGSSYKVAWLELEIVMISSLLLVPVSTVNNLSYAYKKYSYVFWVGLALSLPRLILYILLTPIMASTGTAMSFAVGSVTGVIAALIAASKIGLNLETKKLLKIFLISFLIGGPIGFLLKVFIAKLWILGFGLTVLVNYLVLMKLKILEENDLKEIAKAVIPKKLQPTIYDLVKPILDLIYS